MRIDKGPRAAQQAESGASSTGAGAPAKARAGASKRGRATPGAANKDVFARGPSSNAGIRAPRGGTPQLQQPQGARGVRLLDFGPELRRQAMQALSSQAAKGHGDAGRASQLVSWTPNPTAMAQARKSMLGTMMEQQVSSFAKIYREAERLTGVPAAFIAAIHANESGFGTNRASVRGPESGFGLDDRFVSTRFGNEKLAGYGLGKWQRGKDSPQSCLQSAVVAAEWLKGHADGLGVSMGYDMTAVEVAAVITSYGSGPGAGRRALEKGESWVFCLDDPNPHPKHPGGTSRRAGGRTVRVRGGRAQGLRWDVLVPLLTEQLQKSP